MKIHEYQAKDILKNYGIPVPKSGVAKTPEQARDISEEISKKSVIKAQIHVGGRGKAGGIKVVNNPDEAFNEAKNIIDHRIKGLLVNKVLVEEALDIEKEYYLSITMDRSTRKNILMVSSAGGIDIEEVAAKSPEKIQKSHIDPAFGIQDFEIKKLVGKLDFTKFIEKEFSRFVKILYKLYIESDANLVEINPLVITKDNKLIAADAKILLDDNAMFRHKNFEVLQEIAEDDPIEREARKKNIPYVRLDGDIGIIGNGAGLVMTTLDMVSREGGKASNFLDIGGGAGAEKVKQSLDLIMMDKNLNGIFINIFGGITRCDEVAKGIIEAVNALKLSILSGWFKQPENNDTIETVSSIQLSLPIVIRLSGTKEDEGRKLLEDAGFEVGRDMNEGAKKIVELARAYAKGREAL